MIYVTRPVVETHKTVPKTTDKSLDDNPNKRRPIQNTEEERDGQSRNNEFQEEHLKEAISQTNSMIFKDDNRFEFKIHERIGRIMVKLINKETDEVIKEIPPEKILDLVASIWDLVGILVDERG